MAFSASAVWRPDVANSRELEWAPGGLVGRDLRLYAEKKAVTMIVVLTRMLAPRFEPARRRAVQRLTVDALARGSINQGSNRFSGPAGP